MPNPLSNFNPTKLSSGANARAWHRFSPPLVGTVVRLGGAFTFGICTLLCLQYQLYVVAALTALIGCFCTWAPFDLWRSRSDTSKLEYLLANQRAVFSLEGAFISKQCAISDMRFVKVVDVQKSGRGTVAFDRVPCGRSTRWFGFNNIADAERVGASLYRLWHDSPYPEAQSGHDDLRSSDLSML